MDIIKLATLKFAVGLESSIENDNNLEQRKTSGSIYFTLIAGISYVESRIRLSVYCLLFPFLLSFFLLISTASRTHGRET